MVGLPSGTVTFLFTDIEGSTRLWELHPEAMRLAVARHDALLRQAIETHGGHVFKTVGDQFCAAFATAPGSVAAALEAQRALKAEGWKAASPLKVRMALHTGTAELRASDYFGAPLNRLARLLTAGHGSQILLSQSTADLVREALPPGASLRDLGSHRLKDLQEPERIFQFLHPDLPADFPPLRSLEAFAHNLPRQLTSFIGREEEMVAVKRLLSTAALVTLTGAGGCGKTRLALQAAAELVEELADGVWLVELAALADPDLVPQVVITTLGVREEPKRSLTAVLIDYLRQKTLLLVLDNCEHLLAACAQLAETLLRSCSHLRILATSREGLGIVGEQTYRVPSLSVPNPQQLPPVEHLGTFEAVRLFADRAVLNQPTFRLTAANAVAVAQVCQRLDGIPLAIELAAARVKTLPPEQIAQRLDARFRLLTGGSRTALPRQQTLQATLDWSWNLLSGSEQALLQRLTVFAGGWTLEAAEAVCAGDGIEAGEVFDLLSRLADKSLVVYREHGGEARYHLLETIRQYAWQKLQASGQAEAVRTRHLCHFVRWVVEDLVSLRGVDLDHDARWLNRLETENDNLRAALEWSQVQQGYGEPVLRLAGELWWFWASQGYVTEGRRWLALMLSNPDATAPRAARASALQGAGHLALDQGDYLEAWSYYQESLQILQELGDKPGMAWSLITLGNAAFDHYDLVRAHTLYEEALTNTQELGDRKGIAAALFGLANVHRIEGDFSRAQSLSEESLAYLGSNWLGVAWTLVLLGNIAVGQGDWATASSRYQESLRMFQMVGDKGASVWVLERFAALAEKQGQVHRGAQLFGAAEALREAGGSVLSAGDRVEYYDQSVAATRAALDEPSFSAAWKEGRAMTLEHAISYALAGDAE